MKLPTNVIEQVLYNTGYRGIAKRSYNKHKPVVIKNADVSIFSLILSLWLQLQFAIWC